jgi:aspartate beta-hydroxylase
MTEDINRLFRSAVEAHDSGRGDEALELYVTVLQRAPQHVQAIFRLAMLVSQAGHADEAAPLLEKAIELEPRNGEFRFRFGQALARMGELQRATTELQRAVDFAPENVEALLRLGVLYLRTRRRNDALVAFQRALTLAPQLRQWPSDSNLSAEFREVIGIALGELREKFVSFTDDCLRQVQARYPGDDLSRLEAGLRNLGSAKSRAENVDAKRRPALLNFPDLPDTPWFESDEFEWAEHVESATSIVHDELAQLLASQAEFTPYCTETDSANVISAAGTDFSSLAGSMSWNALHLYQNSHLIDKSASQCPNTMALMDSLPMPRIRNHSPEIFFSCLQPDGHIIPHHGLMNVRLTVHLGLVVPEGCGIRVGDETRTWEPGRLLFFDDSYEHEAWNRGASDRVVLILEAWNPHLTAAEREGVEIIFKLRRDWLDQFDVYRHS